MITAAAITKRFGAVQALAEVDFDLKPGEIHGLVGENGAGKSTLVKILAGVYPPDSGHLYADGKTLELRGPQHAYDVGIRIVHQELSLVSTLTVAENLYLHEFSTSSLRWVNRGALTAKAAQLLDGWQLDISPTLKVERLAMAKRQLVEIVREVSKKGRVIILDEPTSSLTSREINQLFQVLGRLKEQNFSIVFISHRLDEVLHVADRVTVLRNGRRIDSRPRAQLDLQRLVSLIVGGEVDSLFAERVRLRGEKILSVQGLSGKGFSDISFDLHRGEILGVAGLIGAGRSRLLRSVFGINPTYGGTIELQGKRIEVSNPARALQLGIALLSESRIDEGIFPELTVASNLILMKLEEVTEKGWLRADLINKKVAHLVDSFKVVTYDPHRQPVNQLSGGNQQKVFLARLMGANPQILLLDEPTRGVDVGTKAEIHRIMAGFVQQGNAIMMASSDLSELVAMCDRILVLSRGRATGHFIQDEFSEETILRCAMERAGDGELEIGKCAES